MKIYILLLTFLFTSFAVSAQNSSNESNCVKTDECFEFFYKEPKVNSNGTVTLSFSVKVNCNRDLSYAAFELPAGAKASAYSPNIKVENTTNNPFYSIKFEMKDGYKNGKTADFSYTVTAEQFASMTTIRAQAKAALSVGTVTFDAKGCGEGENPGGEQPEEPICVIESDGGLFNFGYLGATANADNTTTVRFSIENTTTSPITLATVEVPNAPQPIEAIAPEGFIAEVDEESGFITYIRVDDATEGGETVVFGFIVPTESHELIPFYTLGLFTADGEAAFTGFNTLTCDDTPIEPLPVELSSFEGKATSSGIELTWTTASELNNDRFEVQRSTNGKTYTTIGTVKGAGNSSATLSYSYTDPKAANGVNYYRIKQVDLDGTSDISKVIALEGNGAKATSSMTIYPNPAVGNQVNITLDNAVIGQNNTYVVVITDMNGRKVFEQQLDTTSNSELNLSLDQLRIAKGLYMVKIQGNNLVETQKLLVK